MPSESPVKARFRAVALGQSQPTVARREASGIWHLWSQESLAPYPARLLDRLVQGAERYPDRCLVAQRDAGGGFRCISYAEMLSSARRIASALLERTLSAERPIAILSGNDLEHLQLALGAMWAGIPYCPVSAAYALLSRDFAKLRHVLATLTPGLVFASDATRYGSAIEACVPGEVEVVLVRGELDRRATAFSSLLTQPAHGRADAAYAATGPDTLVKLLFTSGSTKTPKAVLTTHRMLCANQQMILQALPFLGEQPPIQVDWLPWNHTFGGSHNFGIALYNGGTYYIDEGKPTPALFGETLRNLREIAPTVYFTVPKAWEDLTAALEGDEALARNFLSRMKLFMYAGAGLSQTVWDRLDAVAERICGERIPMVTGLGMTEASPACTFALRGPIRAGYVGLPVPGCGMKLVPVDGKLEVRVAGPHVTPGYFRNAEETATAFDEDGYYCTGDAVKLIDPEDPRRGLMFDGRLVEDFKLSSGTFVSVGPLRAQVIAEGAPYVQDVVIVGPDRAELALLIFPRLDECRARAMAGPQATVDEVLSAPPIRAFFSELVERLHQRATGSATRIARALVLSEPPSIAHGEITDKNSINQRAVLTRRAGLVDAVYEGREPDIIVPCNG